MNEDNRENIDRREMVEKVRAAVKDRAIPSLSRNWSAPLQNPAISLDRMVPIDW